MTTEPPETPDAHPRRPQDVPPGEVEAIRRRLRRGLAGRSPAPAEPIVLPRELPRRDRPAAPSMPAGGPFVVLEQAVAGQVVQAPGGGSAFLIERRLGGPDGPWAQLVERFAAALGRGDSPLGEQLARAGLTVPAGPRDVLLLDLETTGLSCTPLFLVGAMVWDETGPVVRQYFARDYSEERAAVELFARGAARPRLLISFNGKSYDLPFLRMRAAANAVDFDLDSPHLDLLHAARRLWKHRLPDCRLQTLERLICGRPRHEDIPGHLIPDAYHAYVRTGNAAHMVDVLEHNFLDLVTLVDLTVRMAGV